MVDLPRRNPQLIVSGFVVPGAQNTTIMSYRGPWAQGVVYNEGDLASFQQEDGRPGLLLICVQAHTSGEIFDSSQWAALIDYERLVLNNDTSGLAARVSALELALEEGNFSLVDGNLTQILVRRYSTAELGSLPSTIVPEGEFWYNTDSDPPKLAFGNGTEEFANLVNILTNDITSELEELYNNTIEAQVAAESAKELARQWASAAPGTEIEPGLESSFSYATRAQQMLRVLAGFPTRPVSGDTTLQKTTSATDPKDEFGVLHFSGLSANADLTLPKDWNVTPGPAGRAAWIACKVINEDATWTVNFVTEGSAPAAVAYNGTWQGSTRFTVDPPTTTPNVVRTISVPAGVKRVLVISTFEINFATSPTHQIGLSADVGTLTEIVAATANNGSFSSGNRPSVRGWKLVLPDSTSAATDVTLTFTIPDKTYAFVYRVRSGQNVDSVGNPAGDSPATASLTPSASVVAGANSIAFFDIAMQGKPLPVADVDELTTVDPQNTTGALKLKDIARIGGAIAGAGAGTRTLQPTFTSDDAGNPKKYGYMVFTFEPAVAGGAGTDIIAGPTSLAPGETATIWALNDGRTYFIEKAA